MSYDDDFNDDFLNDLNEGFKDARKHVSDMNELYEKLRIDPCMTEPEVGNKVIFLPGMINEGHLWIRKEAVVLEVASSAIKIRYDSYGQLKENWIDPNLIVDVLK